MFYSSEFDLQTVANSCTAPTILAARCWLMLTSAALKMVTVLKMTALIPDHCWKNMMTRQSKNGCQIGLLFNSEKNDNGRTLKNTIRFENKLNFFAKVMFRKDLIKNVIQYCVILIVDKLKKYLQFIDVFRFRSRGKDIILVCIQLHFRMSER